MARADVKIVFFFMLVFISPVLIEAAEDFDSEAISGVSKAIADWKIINEEEDKAEVYVSSSLVGKVKKGSGQVIKTAGILGTDMSYFTDHSQIFARINGIYTAPPEHLSRRETANLVYKYGYKTTLRYFGLRMRDILERQQGVNANIYDAGGKMILYNWGKNISDGLYTCFSLGTSGGDIIDAGLKADARGVIRKTTVTVGLSYVNNDFVDIGASGYSALRGSTIALLSIPLVPIRRGFQDLSGIHYIKLEENMRKLDSLRWDLGRCAENRQFLLDMPDSLKQWRGIKTMGAASYQGWISHTYLSKNNLIISRSKINFYQKIYGYPAIPMQGDFPKYNYSGFNVKSRR